MAKGSGKISNPGGKGGSHAWRTKKSKKPSLKNQLRAVTRLLAKDLPEDVRAAQEKRMAEIKEKMAETQKSDRERKLATKYKKIRFVDRRKLGRLIARVERELNDSSLSEAKTKELEAEKSKLEEDMKYVMCFPKGEKYVSIFSPRQGTDKCRRRFERLKAMVKAKDMKGGEEGNFIGTDQDSSDVE